MKRRKWLILLGSILLLLVMLNVFTPDASPHPYYDGVEGTLVIAHQGGDGVWPGNTLYAFEKAVETGADILEMDAHIAKDGHIVLMHDETVDDTTDGTGFIEEMTLDELKELDAGYDWSNDGGQTFPYRGQGVQVPALEELFQKFPQMHYAIEIKLTENPVDETLCALIRQYNMQNRVLVASFHDEAMQAFRETCPEVATSASRGEVTKFVLLGKVFLSGLVNPAYESIQPPFDPEESMNIPIMTKRFIREAHAKNIKVEPWTVDDPELMKQYIEWGVDGIITDRPDLMVEILGR
ncbi:MAG TPA: glycerophosphodiester phosphodiesterase [Anaerolineales bacterium]|nr:glycerophosphodiester phosphodiesterase [Anaerolineales bacterium]